MDNTPVPTVSKKKKRYVCEIFGFLKDENLKIIVLRGAMPCDLVDSYYSFEDRWCLYLRKWGGK